MPAIAGIPTCSLRPASNLLSALHSFCKLNPAPLSFNPLQALYLDADNIVMQDPMKPFDIDYDVQGLSDWLGPELPPTGVIGHDCGLYKWAPSDAVPYGRRARVSGRQGRKGRDQGEG